MKEVSDLTRLILASDSPRRKELLERMTPTFECIPASVNEEVDSNLKPHEVVKELALRKAQAVSANEPAAYVIGADTIVVCQGKIFGKPKDHDEAFRMLKQLSGNTHSVYTGVAIVFGEKIDVFAEETKVTFWELTDGEINDYISTGEPFDKAGSYGIQGFGATLVKGIKGDFFNVVGLPVARVYRTLKNMGFSFSRISSHPLKNE